MFMAKQTKLLCGRDARTSRQFTRSHDFFVRKLDVGFRQHIDLRVEFHAEFILEFVVGAKREILVHLQIWIQINVIVNYRDY